MDVKTSLSRNKNNKRDIEITMIEQGTVKKVLTKNWQDKTLYSLILNESEKIFGLGTFRLKAKPGDFVKFEYSVNKNGYPDANTKTLEVTENKEAIHTEVSAKAAGRASGLSKDDYWNRKEARDLRQDELREIGATRNTAVEWIKFLMEKEALKLPTKMADREQALNALLNDYIDRFRGIGHSTSGTLAKTDKPAVKATLVEPAASVHEDDWDSGSVDAS
jgi:hypothetical protein